MPTIQTSESVCKGHPDKIADQISDAIVDAALQQDPAARLGAETLVTKGLVVLGGEVTTKARLDYETIVKEVIRENGYTNPDWDFSDDAKVLVQIQQQSPDIAQGVDDGGAGDQGFNVGYATNETPQLMPLTLTIARALTAEIDTLRETNSIPWLRPDGKSQVSIAYDDAGKAQSITQVTIAAAHHEDIEPAEVQKTLEAELIKPVLDRFGLPYDKATFIVNGTGVWHIPGPTTDAGLTGRKIVVDAYGSAAKVGGGAFSGKDPSKVDRSGAYAARWYARKIVEAKLADQATVYLAWAIGHQEPLSFRIETVGGKESEAELIARCKEWLKPTVGNIIKSFNLRQPIYRFTAANGHFGHTNLPWENEL